MTLEDSYMLLHVLNQAYPNTYKNMTDDEKNDQANFYLDMFGEEESAIVVHALKNYIKKNKFPPTVAGLQEQIELLTDKGNTSEELWNKVTKAISHSLYNSLEEYNKLPVECQRWLGSPQGLKDLGTIDLGTVNTVIRGQFLKTIGEIKASQNAQLGMPQELKNLINQCKYALTEGE